jgi:di/tricarboxylate transporter
VTLDTLVVLAVLAAAVALFASGRFPVDLVALLVMAVLLVTGAVTPQQGIAGFSNPATVTVAAMFVLSAGLFRSGAVNFAGQLLTRLGRSSVWMALFVMMTGIGALSAFVNNTAAVAIFLPIVIGTARALDVSPSRLLMPLSFASMFGGVCTLIGTSTNLLVSAIAEEHGQPAIGMFEMSRLGLIFFAAGLAYMMLVGVRLIPGRRGGGELAEQYGMGDYLVEIVLGEGAKSVGRAIAESPLVTDVGVGVLDVIRDGERIPFPSPSLVLRAGDVLRVRADVARIATLQDREGITLRPRARWAIRKLEDGPTVQVEAIVAPLSELEGRTLRQVRFAATFGAMVLAIRHHGRLRHENLGDTRLRAGDALLVEVPRERVETLRRDRNFVLVSELALPRFRRAKILPAVAIIAGVVGVATAGLAPILVTAVAGCALMVLTRCLTLEEAYAAVEWKVIVLLAGVLTLGVAMENTGTATWLADLVVRGLGPFGPMAVVAGFYLLTSLLTEAMSNNATAVLLAPVAIAAADGMGIDARPLLMAVAFAASSSFMTPVGYQTNTMILGAGNFRFGDFVRVGGPLNLLFLVLATLLIPVFWPF